MHERGRSALCVHPRPPRPAAVHERGRSAGAQWLGHDTWEPVDQLQSSHVKDLINAFNQKLRETCNLSTL
jgi:hypothetical protein